MPLRKKAPHLLSSQEYENAMFNDLYYVYRPPTWEVRPDLRTVRGQLSQQLRQIDVSVHRNGSPRPTLVVECKRYNHPLHVKDVESFLGMLDDLGAAEGVLVSPLGWSPAAERRVQSSRAKLFRLPEKSAVRLNWRELARAVFPWDEGFHPQMGNVFDSLMSDTDIDRCIDDLDGVPFEEWETVIRVLAGRKPAAIGSMLYSIAGSHPEDGWRYNAIRLLEDYGALDDVRIEELVCGEADPETREFLNELLEAGAGT